MKFLDLFAGIGGFRTGLEKVGHQCVGYVEIDKYARKSYENIYNTEGEWTAHDVTKVTGEEWREFRGRVDIITGGFPCQAFSTAGKRRGFDDTRGTLFFEVARAAKEIQPSFLFLENVKGLFNHDKGQTFGTIIQALDELGYVVEWGLFNSKFWGVPQNRERVFILATRKDVFEKPKLFDLLKQQENFKQTFKLLDVLEDKVDEKFYLTEEQMSKLDIKLNSPDREIKQVANRKGYNNNTRTYDPTGITGTLDTAGGGGRELHVAIQPVFPDEVENKGTNPSTGTEKHAKAVEYDRKNGIGKDLEYAHTLNSSDWRGLNRNQKQNAVIQPVLTQDRHGVALQSEGIDMVEGFHIRKLTPLECFRLQGFTDEQFYKAKNAGISNSQLYKQAGNSVTVNVIEAIAKTL